jgi:hypothetical protein
MPVCCIDYGSTYINRELFHKYVHSVLFRSFIEEIIVVIIVIFPQK